MKAIKVLMLMTLVGALASCNANLTPQQAEPEGFFAWAKIPPMGWNSWDLLLHPRTVLADVITRLANPLHHPATYGVTMLFAMFLLVCYLTIVVSPLREHS